MPLWKVSRTDRCDYEEYYAVVVRAATAEAALAFATRGLGPWDDPYDYGAPGDDTAGPGEPWWDGDNQRPVPGFTGNEPNLKAEQIPAGGPDEAILASFRAG